MQSENDLCSSLAAVHLNESKHSHEQPLRPRTVLGDVTNTWQPASTWKGEVKAQPAAEQWCNQLPHPHLPSNFMQDASFAAHDQHYEMQLPTPSHAYQQYGGTDHLQICQNSTAPPFGGSMQHEHVVHSYPEHASSSRQPWQREEGGPQSLPTAASMPNSNSLLPPPPASFNSQSQLDLGRRYQQLNDADTQHSSAQHERSVWHQQAAQLLPEHQLPSSHSRRHHQYRQPAVATPLAAACSDQWASRQPMAPVRPVAAAHTSTSRRLQARRTIYVCDIDCKVKEVALANLFMPCGKIVDCRLCCDLNSALRFAFIEFDSEAAVDQALQVNGMQLGGGTVRVTRSRTAMNPVKQEFLPRSHEERERCGRTVYVANVDERLEAADVRRFFSKFCGHISAMRLLRSTKAPTQIAFVEFANADAASAALDWSGSLLGSMQIRIAPSKTPIRRVE